MGWRRYETGRDDGSESERGRRIGREVRQMSGCFLSGCRSRQRGFDDGWLLGGGDAMVMMA